MTLLSLQFGLFRTLVCSRTALALENLALRQQLAAFRRSVARPRLRRRGRMYWVCLSQIWNGWRSTLVIVQPATVVSWHRQGFRLYWRWKSHGGKAGRPKVEREIRDLGRRRVSHFNVTANPSSAWTAQQITEAFPYDSAPRYLMRDRDGIYGEEFQRRMKCLGIEEVVSAPRAPWQNPHIE